MAVGDKSPAHMTIEPDTSYSVNLAGPKQMGRSSLQYQGNSYTILDKSMPEQAFYLTQGDPLLELLAFLEAHQLALSRRFRDFAFMRFDSAGLPQVAFNSVGPVQPYRHPAQAPPHTVSTGTLSAAARSQAGAPSLARSSSSDFFG